MFALKKEIRNPNNNAKLRDLIAKAKSNNVPNDNIERLIKKASGDGNKASYESLTYEGYGPSGVAVIVECLTDNRIVPLEMCECFAKIGWKSSCSSQSGSEPYAPSSFLRMQNTQLQEH